MPDQQKYIYEETYQIAILPDFLTIAYPTSDLPEKVGFICKIMYVTLYYNSHLYSIHLKESKGTKQLMMLFIHIIKVAWLPCQSASISYDSIKQEIFERLLAFESIEKYRDIAKLYK